MRLFSTATVAAMACCAAVSIHAQPPSFLMAACGGETTRVAEVTLPHPASSQPSSRRPIWINHEGTNYIINVPPAA